MADVPGVLTAPLDEKAQSEAKPAPVDPSERVAIIDVIRGLALFGILAANFRGFAAPAAVYFDPALYWPALHDRIAQGFVDTFIQGKFITIFAFLFGLGFAAQLERAEARGIRFGRLFSRRMAILVAFGFVHGLLIWFGDILLAYALIGLLLLFFRRRKEKTLLVWAAVFYLIPLVIVGGIIGASAAGAPIPEQHPPSQAELQRIVAAYGSGSFAELQGERAKEVFGMNWGMMPIGGWQILGLFLAGTVAWKRRLLQPSAEALPRFRRITFVALTLGITGNVAAVGLRWLHDLSAFSLSPPMIPVFALQIISVPALSAGYVGAVVLLSRNAVWRARFSRFGAVGRMALTNYLLQSIVGTTIFYSYGLGLFGKGGPALFLVPTVVLFAILAYFSSWWLARWRFGPVEWLWRSLTYGRVERLSHDVLRRDPGASSA
jgi:uncharacterized protein